MNGNSYNWIQTWLTHRSQCVVLDSESSSPVPVLSGVPQRTVLGPLMFLLYINDITKDINSPLRLFADDCLELLTVQKTPTCFKKTCRIGYQNGQTPGNLDSMLVNVLSYIVQDP